MNPVTLRLALEPNKPPALQTAGEIFQVVKRPEHEANHSPLSRAEVDNSWSFISMLYIRLHGVVLSQRGNFTFNVIQSTC